jgi:D-glycero-D-manno-heptose 1,7-bisphosphate phosphatase
MRAPSRQKRRAVFLDRDGVLNKALVRNGRPFSPIHPEDFAVIPGIAEACQRLRQDGFLLAVVTNQPDVARGRQTRSGVATIHSLLRAQVPLDGIYMCPHDDTEDCSCRKPKAGMLFAAAEDLHLDLARSVMVGDRWSDIEAGHRAGCRTIFVDYGYKEQAPDAPDQIVTDPVDALTSILDYDAQRSGYVLPLGERA